MYSFIEKLNKYDYREDAAVLLLRYEHLSDIFLGFSYFFTGKINGSIHAEDVSGVILLPNTI